MKLRRQLLLVSLFLLSLPWAGCQYVRQMESALRDGQAKALAATAQAVAARMSSEAVSIDLPTHPAIYSAEQQVYLHPLRNHAIVDGYDEEWLALEIASAKYTHPEHEGSSLTSYAGWYGEDIYLFFAAEDATRDYHNPQQPGIASGDRLSVRALLDPFTIREYVFRAGATGTVVARYVNEHGDIRQEHRIRGEWRDTATGYEIELRIPMRLAPMGLDYQYIDASAIGDLRLGNSNLIDYPAPWVKPSMALAQVLEPYSDGGLRLSVVNEHQWLLAQAGGLSAPRPVASEENHPLLSWLYRLAIGQQDFVPLVDARRSGRMVAPETDRALDDLVGIGWYQNGNQRVGRVAAPIRQDGRIIGAVAVEQSTDGLLAETNAAFNSLFLYTVLATCVAGFGLLAYASWLSFRIRRLNRAAESAVSEDGRIRPELLRSRAGDEIGDLTRSYARVLTRLRDYTDYLRTLSSKLSHELRTPLAVMNSSLDNLDHEGLGESADVYVQRARQASQRLSGILNAMSSASRMEEGIQQAQREEFPLDELLTGVTTAYRSTYPQASFELSIAASSSGYRFDGSPDLIVQMLDKLVDNALDFCPPDGRITLALFSGKHSHRLSVSNTGPLLPQHMQGQLFDSLVSVREKQNGNEEKTHLGLGLYIVRLIADFHGGQVTARNLEDGSGAIFEVKLPVRALR
ncbi:proteobacterial dedicated sortase system histidine kinase [Proteobacteria bacterium 005FR1]|nr:proteobacterial dedicated sortase system histidine kinase [Proteobacteria bacterium 005FR1]